MADNVEITAGTGTTIAADEVSDGTLGSCKVQYVKIMDGTLAGTTKAAVGASGLAVSAAQSGTWNVGTVTAVTALSNALPAGTNNIGDVDVLTLGGQSPAFGSGAAGSSTLRVTLDTNQVGTLGITTPASSVPVAQAGYIYETVAASQTAQVLGGSGATGDYLATVLIIPATRDAGAVNIIDLSTSTVIFVGGTSSCADLKPFSVNIGAFSANGAWKITTGAAVSVVAFGKFT